MRSTGRSASAGSDASRIGHALRLVEDDTAALRQRTQVGESERGCGGSTSGSASAGSDASGSGHALRLVEDDTAALRPHAETGSSRRAGTGFFGSSVW